MREELEIEILTTVRDNPSGATSRIVERHPRGEVMEAIAELTRDGFVESLRREGMSGPWFDLLSITVRGSSLLHDLEHAE